MKSVKWHLANVKLLEWKYKILHLYSVIRRSRLQKTLKQQVEDLSWIIGVEKNDSKELLDKYEKGRKLLDSVNDYIENGL